MRSLPTASFTQCVYQMMCLRNLSHDIKTLAAVVQIFNPGLNQILSKVFLQSQIMQLELRKYCRAFTPRYSNDNRKCYSKVNIQLEQNLNPGWISAN